MVYKAEVELVSDLLRLRRNGTFLRVSALLTVGMHPFSPLSTWSDIIIITWKYTLSGHTIHVQYGGMSNGAMFSPDLDCSVLSNTGSPGIILGLPPSQHTCGRHPSELQKHTNRDMYFRLWKLHNDGTPRIIQDCWCNSSVLGYSATMVLGGRYLNVTFNCADLI